MPIFEYVCQECQHEFEALVFGRDKAKCPKCQSKKLSPQLSVFAVSAKGSPARRQLPLAPAAPAAILAVQAPAPSATSTRLLLSVPAIFACFTHRVLANFRHSSRL